MPGFSITRKIGNSLVLPMQVTEDGDALSLTGKTVAYRLYAIAGDDAVLEFTVATGRLEVTDAAQGLIELTASAADMDFDPGTYLGCLEITDASDTDYALELPDDEAGDLWTFIDQLSE